MMKRVDFTSRTTTFLAGIFFFSGFSSLIYQVVWQRVLTMYYGIGAISMTLIVSIYMFGLGIGALIGGFLAERAKQKILLYFFVELLIGCFGIISLPFLNFLGKYTAGSSYILASLYLFLFLSFPTLFMGITLPLLTKIFNSFIHNFLNSISFLYFINTLGAAFGAIFASYVVISFFGLDIGIYFSVVINFIIAVLIFLISRNQAPQPEPIKSQDLSPEKRIMINKTAYLLVFVTGFLAIGYEIIWFRIVGIFVKASPYVFSSVLFIYLLGIALGSYNMNKIINRYQIDRKSLFFILQFLIGVYVLVIVLAYFYLTKYTGFDIFTRVSFKNIVHPSFPVFHSCKEFLKSIYYLFDVFFWAMIFVFIPTIFMGASFPLISSLALKNPHREGSTVGKVYFFNIVGNVFGGLITGFILLPFLSSETTLMLFSSIGLLFGLFSEKFSKYKFQLRHRVTLVAFLILSGLMFLPQPGELYQTIHTSPGEKYDTFLEEDIDGVVVTYKYEDNLINYISGIAHGWRPLYLYHYETSEAIKYAAKVENVLIIGFGNGTITEIVLKLPTVKKITIIEINHALIKNLLKIPLFQEMLANTKVDLVIDDGRRFLYRTDRKFDLILIDPLRTRTAYSNNLYSHQFFKLMNAHLTPTGVLMVWMDEYKVMPKTILSAFNHVLQYKFFCLASNMPFQNNEALEHTLLSHFTDDELEGKAKYDDSYLGDEKFIQDQTANYPINQDWKPVCEYYIGLLVKEQVLRKYNSL